MSGTWNYKKQLFVLVQAICDLRNMMKRGNWIVIFSLLFITLVLVSICIRVDLVEKRQSIKLISSNEHNEYDKNQHQSRPMKFTPDLNFERLCKEDQARINDVLNFDHANATLKSITTILAKTVSNPIQMGCKILKRVGKFALCSPTISLISYCGINMFHCEIWGLPDFAE